MLPPMPSADEINKEYNALMVIFQKKYIPIQHFFLKSQLGFGKDFKHPTAYQTSSMAEQSLENKWAMICQYKTIEVILSFLKSIEYIPFL